MNNDLYNDIVTVIEAEIERVINRNLDYSWRETKVLKSQVLHESINCLIDFVRNKNCKRWKKFHYSKLSNRAVGKLKKSFENIVKDEKSIELSISVVYQMILADDLRLINGKYMFMVDKHNRDNLGSYYTPDWLADELTDKTVTAYLDKVIGHDKLKQLNSKLFQNIKVIDLSVGAGAFLKAYIRWIKRNISNDISEVLQMSRHIYGVDVDPIALLICEHEVSSELNGEIEIIKLCLGNPLIKNDRQDAILKERMFHEGRIYNKETGISFSSHEIKFDIIIGNPPWEKIRFEDKKFFNQKYPDISSLAQKNVRNIAIEKLEKLAPLDYEFYKDTFTDYLSVKNLLKSNSLLHYSLCGELNTYNLFYELALNLLTSNGVVGMIVKSSMVKAPVNKKLFNYLVSNGLLFEVDLIKNSKKIFSIDSREEFAFVICKKSNSNNFSLLAGITSIEDFLEKKDLIEITPEILKKFNPDSGMLPNISTSEEIVFLKKMHDENPLFSEVFSSVKFGRLVHFTNHSNQIYKSIIDGIPIYEGKFIERYDSRFSTFEGMNSEEKYKPKASARIQTKYPKNVPESRYFINPKFWDSISKGYDNKITVMWRSLTSSTNKRTMLATMLPFMPTSQSIQFLQASDIKASIIILSIFNSIIFDYLVRLKIPGIDLTQTVVKSIPVPHLEMFDKTLNFNGKFATYYEHIAERVCWLYREESRLEDVFAHEKFEEKFSSKKKVESEIDQIIGSAYGLSYEDIKKIASQFPACYSSKEIKLFF